MLQYGKGKLDESINWIVTEITLRSFILGSVIDYLYGIVSGKQKFFKHGFSDIEHIKHIKQNMQWLIDSHPINVKWTSNWIHEKNIVYREGSFESVSLGLMETIPIHEVCKTGKL